ncbi:AMP-binding protein [Streptomyces sp. YU58]|uniref:AMP-binding protein n=1 Tax=Streptomyces sp. SX92 TaxID=3158972 RepID=UPI0027BAD2D1|nr:AMP-binding protein [Streptomyces coralus]WLW51672.1 AMP-binding protein [Streptomyces coralus]
MPTSSLVASLNRHAGESPNLDALVSGSTRLTYRQLADRAHELGRQLPPDTGLLCVSARKSPEAVALLLACFQQHRQVLLPSAELGADALRRLASQAHYTHIVSTGSDGAAGKDAADGAGEAAGALSVVRLASVLPPRSGLAPRTSPLLLTTSGSTGLPKIVPLPEDGMDRFMTWAAAHFGTARGTRVLSYAPLNFDLSLLDVWATLGAGGTVVLVPPERATDGPHLLETLAATRVQLVQSVPMLFRLLADAAEGAGRTLPDVRHVLLTGEATPPELLARTARLFPAARIHNVYGCTETNDSFVYEVDRAEERAELPLGVPLPGVTWTLLTGEGRELTGEGTGELVVRTPFQTDGYLDSALNVDRFLRPPGGGAVHYRTGDLAHRTADGALTLRGRADFQVKVRGVRTNLQDVEQALLLHPDVEEAVVVALPDPEAGVLLHAVIRLTRVGERLNSLALRSHCARHLPRTAIPGSLNITDEPLPRTSTGKPDRQSIKERWLAKG